MARILQIGRVYLKVDSFKAWQRGLFEVLQQTEEKKHGARVKLLGSKRISKTEKLNYRISFPVCHNLTRLNL